MTRLIKTAFAAAVLAAVSFPASGQQGPWCAPVQTMVGWLGSGQGQTVVASGVATNGNPVRWMANEAGAWTMVVIDEANGVACVVSAGDGWSATEAEADGDPA